MPSLNFDATQVAPSAAFEPLPAGKYNVLINDSVMKDNKSGNGRYLQLEMEVIDGDYRGRKLWSRLNLENPNPEAVRLAQADLSAICHAVNVLRPKDSCELHNLPLTVTVKLRRMPDGGLVNEIKGYETRARAVQPTPQAQQAAPRQPVTPPWVKK